MYSVNAKVEAASPSGAVSDGSLNVLNENLEKEIKGLRDMVVKLRYEGDPYLCCVCFVRSLLFVATVSHAHTQITSSLQRLKI